MRTFIQTILVGLLVGTTIFLVACNGEDSPATAPVETKQPTNKPLVDETSGQTQGSGESSTSTVKIGGITFHVKVAGTLKPNAALDVSIAQAGGARPAAIRVWVGVESGVGSIKTKTHSHGSTYHAHATAPATIPANCAVWIEVQAANGNRSAGSVVLH